MKQYITIAHRWGETNNDQYIVYVGPDLDAATSAMRAQPEFRGGKYGAGVYEFSGTSRETHLIDYAPSMLGVFAEDASHGAVWVIDNDNEVQPGVHTMKRMAVECPPWLAEEVGRRLTNGMGAATTPTPRLLALAERCGARITGKPDGSESIAVLFTIEAWRAFDSVAYGALVGDGTGQALPPVSNEEREAPAIAQFDADSRPLNSAARDMARRWGIGDCLGRALERPAPEPCPRGADKPEPTCTNRHQCWEPCGELGHSEEHARVGREPKPAPAWTDEQIDLILSTQIPGGSTARDWFLPHDLPRGLANVRNVVRRMLAAACGVTSPISAKQIAEWRRLRGTGMISAVGEYTPPEFWTLLDAYEALAHGVPASENLHAQVMNIPCKPREGLYAAPGLTLAYREGHRDARHAAAELIAAHGRRAA